MRSRTRLLEIIETLGADGVGPVAFLALNMAFDILSGVLKAEDIPALFLTRVAEKHDSPHVQELAKAAAHYLNFDNAPAGAMENSMSESFDLVAHLVRQMAWSKATFGPGTRQGGVLDHITKEVAEVRASNGDSSEWVDLVILSLDGLTRQLWASSNYRLTAPEVAAMAVGMIAGKQGRNELREWPDWRTMSADKAIEHVKPAGCPDCGHRHPPDGMCI